MPNGRKTLTSSVAVAEEVTPDQQQEQETRTQEPDTEGNLRAIRIEETRQAGVPPTTRGVEMTPLSLQRQAILGGPGEDAINVMLLIDGSDADGVRTYYERLPLSLVRGLISPNVADFFIPIVGAARMKPASVKAHFLHTSYIREVLLLEELPPAEEA